MYIQVHGVPRTCRSMLVLPTQANVPIQNCTLQMLCVVHVYTYVLQVNEQRAQVLCTSIHYVYIYARTAMIILIHIVYYTVRYGPPSVLVLCFLLFSYYSRLSTLSLSISLDTLDI